MQVATGKPLRVLIIEDDAVDRMQLERLLANSSLDVAEVKCANRLATAIDMLQQSTFDVLLLDLGLPDSQGLESIIQIQTHVPDVPVIVLSGLDDENTATTAVQKGVQDYLIKGQVDSTVLMRSVRYALERKKAERQLQMAEQRYRTIFENSAVAIMMVDREERLISWNGFTEQLLGVTSEELLGRPIGSLYPPAEWQRIRSMSIRQKGMQHHLETQMVHKSGEVIDVDISLSVLRDPDGEPTGSIGVVRDITERKRMESALRESEKRFRQVVANAKEWIWEVNADGLYTYVGPIVERILGYKPEEILGRKYFHDFFHPDDADQLRAQVFEIFSRHDVFSEFQTRNLHKDGRVVWLLRSGVPIFDDHQRLIGYRGADVDITERMRIHEILDRKQKNLEAIFDAAPAAMLLVSEEMVVTRANEAIRQMSGKEFRDIIGSDPCVALGCSHAEEGEGGGAPCDKCSLKRMIQTAFDAGKPIHGVEIRPTLNVSGDGPPPWFLMSVEPVTIDSGRHVVVAFNDITDRKRAEEALKETMELKSQVISTVSHELRTPMTSIREAVSIVLDGVAGKLNKDQTHFLDIARRNLDRLSRLIDEVLDFQKLNAGKMRFEMQENRIERTIEDAYATMQPYAQKKGVHLSTQVDPRLPAAVFDNDRMIQVLTNLISNAIKFTPEGGQICVSVEQQEGSLAIRVSDTGYGIPKEALSKIFDQFYRVHRPGKEIKGTGLGLAIVVKIVNAHNGRIEVESEVDKGTTFTVLLPLGLPRPSEVLSEQSDRQMEKTLAQQSLETDEMP
jgi:PAS domain S-box-containing protein